MILIFSQKCACHIASHPAYLTQRKQLFASVAVAIPVPAAQMGAVC